MGLLAAQNTRASPSCTKKRVTLLVRFRCVHRRVITCSSGYVARDAAARCLLPREIRSVRGAQAATYVCELIVYAPHRVLFQAKRRGQPHIAPLPVLLMSALIEHMTRQSCEWKPPWDRDGQ